MIVINCETGHVTTTERKGAKSKGAGDGRRYYVRQSGPVWEVRCQFWERGKMRSDGLVVACLSEAEAERDARELAEKLNEPIAALSRLVG